MWRLLSLMRPPLTFLTDSTDESECESVESTTEVLMASSAEHHRPPGYKGPKDGSAGTLVMVREMTVHPVMSRTFPMLSVGSVRSSVGRMSDPCTPITGTTPEALTMESACLATLAEQDRLKQLQKELDKRARH